ncbi:MAG: (d)CMP kinase [Clostridia bacterium]|nr:(d)CMP kinase [Clostridia bacterium]
MNMLSIAIDGPVGAGKSTIADEVCRRLGILHLDTGAMYRAVGLAVINAGIDPQDEDAVVALCRRGGALVDVRYSDGAQVTLVNGQDVTGRIRAQEVGTAASVVSRYPDVRHMLVARQRELAQLQPMLLDGRDIGTVVLPDAPVKVYLTATPEARAQRRMNQLLEKGEAADFETILAEVNARDHQDMTRDVDPLRQAEDAVLVDSSDLSFEETVQAILRLTEAANV